MPIAEKEADYNVKVKLGYFRLAANQVFINEIKHIEYQAGDLKQMKPSKRIIRMVNWLWKNFKNKTYKWISPLKLKINTKSRSFK